MRKVKQYTYLGTNGIITSTVHLEGIYSVVKYMLMADEGKILINGEKKVKAITVEDDEISNWIEIDEGQE